LSGRFKLFITAFWDGYRMMVMRGPAGEVVIGTTRERNSFKIRALTLSSRPDRLRLLQPHRLIAGRWEHQTDQV